LLDAAIIGGGPAVNHSNRGPSMGPQREETVDGMKRPRLVGMGGLAKPGP